MNNCENNNNNNGYIFFFFEIYEVKDTLGKNEDPPRVVDKEAKLLLDKKFEDNRYPRNNQ